MDPVHHMRYSTSTVQAFKKLLHSDFDFAKKLGLFAFLYFCEGAPIGLVWWALPTELTSRGVPIETITLITSSLALPWALKFFWGPVIDRLVLPKISYPRWVGFFQMGMALSLVPLAFSTVANTQLLWICLLCHAIFASAQDVATDAWAIRVTQTSERGVLNGVMQTGMIFGRWLFGAGLLLVASIISFEQATTVLAVFLVLSATILIFNSKLQYWGEILREKPEDSISFLKSLTGRRVVFAFLVAIIAGLGYEAFGAVVGPFLQNIGYDKTGVGWFYTFSLFCMGIGSLFGGKLADRIGHYRVYLLSIFLIFTTIAALWMSFKLNLQPFSGGFALGLCIYLFIGVMISSSYAYFIDISANNKNEATTFSLIMAGTNGCEAIAAFGVGRFIPMVGYPLAFLMMGLSSLLSVPLLKLSKR